MDKGDARVHSGEEMTHTAPSPQSYLNQAVGTGQCVALVEAACPAMPHTAGWRKGQQVKGNSIPWGTAIATFDPDGTYANHTDGRSHAAIFLTKDDKGLYVLDQWLGQPVHLRQIMFRGLTITGASAMGTAVNNGDCFSVIETT